MRDDYRQRALRRDEMRADFLHRVILKLAATADERGEDFIPLRNAQSFDFVKLFPQWHESVYANGEQRVYGKRVQFF